MKNKHTIETIISDIKIRLEKAQDTHRQERELGHPCTRTKESAWGKMVAYAHCLRPVTELDYGITKKAVNELIEEMDGETWTKSREIKAITKAYKMIRKREDEIAALWQYHIGVVESIDKENDDLKAEIEYIKERYLNLKTIS